MENQDQQNNSQDNAQNNQQNNQQQHLLDEYISRSELPDEVEDDVKTEAVDSDSSFEDGDGNVGGNNGDGINDGGNNDGGGNNDDGGNGDDEGSEPVDEERVSVRPVLLNDEMKNSYIQYAMSVIIGRALPDARDGLKPVHRRILFSMKENGMVYEKPPKKSAHVVGDVLAKYHPHGDSAVYDSMVRMAQNFSLRYPLIDGQGNFGSIDGDEAAAMRYTEARMAKVSTEMLEDLDKETVDFRPNYDESLQEPAVLPAKLPNLLINGSTGIAVGMATNMPPHNLTEVIDATVMMIDNPDADVPELMTVIKGPDFPTSAVILGSEGIINAYKTGRGSVRIQAVSHIEEMKGNRERIVVTELPYQVNKARLIENIAELVRDKKVTGISDLRDESDRDGIRVVMELTNGTNASVLMNQLYKHTQLQTSFGIINLAIVDGVPRVMGLRQLLKIYLKHRMDVIQRRTLYDLKTAREREHILNGLKIALDNIDPVIELIKASIDAQTARDGLMEQFGLDEIQARAILEMRLQRLTGMEIQKILDELEDVLTKILELEKIAGSDEIKYGIIRDELLEMKEKFGDDRKTQIIQGGFDIDNEDLIQKEDIIITMTNRGYIKRLSANTYSRQRRGGKGIIGMETKDEDIVVNLFVSSTHNYILFFTNKGRVYWKKGYEIPEGSRTSKGKSIVNFLDLKEDETVTAAIPVSEFKEGQYLMMVTKQGTVKKTPLVDFKNPRKAGIIATTLMPNDELVNVIQTDGSREVVMVSRGGKAVRFDEKEVRPMGRSARGVMGMRLVKPDDAVVSMDIVNPEEALLTITENGFGKVTAFDEYIKKHRGTQGVMSIVTDERNGQVVAVKSVGKDDELIITSAEGIIIKIRVGELREQGRNTKGVRIMKLADNDKVVSVAAVKQPGEDESETEDAAENGAENDGFVQQIFDADSDSGSNEAEEDSAEEIETEEVETEENEIE
ncbi:DNA gyrase subunit A [Methanimicrococcus sp. At1]|uniref:DNA gyrase subunit A n=1 Tax=Methanimicrococcus hacksteinii TaxID=3028293 RepID=A0ABU3VN89_9EURY|nr:DNA gyrase subunit A [Methanimicrococcus sp. At1]MDV0444868.1 DNA gyrase subunit A [Methanimicrococcus sp. At1]